MYLTRATSASAPPFLVRCRRSSMHCRGHDAHQGAREPRTIGKAKQDLESALGKDPGTRCCRNYSSTLTRMKCACSRRAHCQQLWRGDLIMRTVTTAVLWMSLCVSATASAANKTFDREVAADPKGIVDISNVAGAIEVTGWDRNAGQRARRAGRGRRARRCDERARTHDHQGRAAEQFRPPPQWGART